ncbi:tetratricopeptide repeat protein [uncultured Tenacibaculum sp.]|uniref:tetratricopeptide repeat protein n=1 Tax=uncultured Tenacibaculum sp. TaxID=174713 RepID=UPI0026168800|nr:tetratricopeptide repeat protein [uncultured Tenacibaculum sp.]
MKNTYFTWDNFANNFGKEMVSAEDVYISMKKNKLTDFTYTKLDFHFLSDKKEKLEKLNEYLKNNYGYSFEKYTTWEGSFELKGKTNSFPITKDNLIYWALDMVKRGYEFDCKLDAYGAEIDKEPILPEFTKSKEDYYFNKAIDLYNSNNLSGAIANWTIVLKINPKEPNSYYSRAIVKNELYTWKSAIADYDKAIELAPNFVSAITNRGTVKDENGDYDGALEDYKTALKLEPNDAMTYFNIGNTKYNQQKKTEACRNWKKANELGAEYAQKRLRKHCE